MQVETRRNTGSGEGREIPGVQEERAQHRADGTAEKGTKVARTGDHSPGP